LEIILKDQAEKGVYSYHNKENYRSLVEYQLIKDDLAQQCAEVALRVWNGLGCRDAGRVDLRMNKSGAINFIEINPLAGLSAANSDLPIMARLAGITYPELIEMIINAALKRISAKVNFC
jgi:D-alanine-D-alanine ligase